MRSETAQVATAKPDELVARVRGAQLPTPSQRKRIRNSAGVTLREMGVALCVTPMTVLRWERGERRPTLEHAVSYRRLLEALEDAVR